LAPAEPISTSTPFIESRTCIAIAGGRVRDTMIRGGPALSATGGTAGVDRVILENSLVPSSGSMIQTRSCVQPIPIIEGLFRQHGIVGAKARELGGQELLRPPVTGGLAFGLVRVGVLGTHLEQHLARFSCEVRC
jgi:hypothetical protein